MSGRRGGAGEEERSSRPALRGRGASQPRYEALDFLVVRAPLLPVATFEALDGDARAALPAEGRTAIAVGSLSLSQKLDSAGAANRLPADVDRALRRYLVRMSTRPTPFGLFAGTAVGRWGERTDLAIAGGRRPQRTRPDGSWLMAIVDRAEATPAIRRALRVFANRSAFVRAGRIVLAERASRGESSAPPAVSIRATGVVRRALDAARTPIPHAQLAALLLDRTPGATPEKVDGLIAELCRQTLLLTELRPPLTVGSPARHVLERLATIPEAGELCDGLRSVIDGAAEWDAAPTASPSCFRALVERARGVAAFDRSPVQVDAGLGLRGDAVSRAVAAEAARAADLLLRLSPTPHGPSHLDGYRRLFEHRYGLHRDVPVLELLDPNVGLGPPPAATASPGPARQGHAAERAEALLDLAATALRERARTVDLDDRLVRRLQLDDVAAEDAPLSLDVTVVVAAASPAAVDAGDFQLAVGPNVGSMAAGRMIGRFADFVPGAAEALRSVAEAETARTPGRVLAELAYAPRSARLLNVSVRPNPRPYEVALGVTPGADAGRSIPVDELVVGVRRGRFRLRWERTGDEVVLGASHMLSYARAPLVARFLSEVGRDGVCQLSGFNWGPASPFPFLPRVRAGRVILSLARWRIPAGTFAGDVLRDRCSFRRALDSWRMRWEAPSRLAVASGDHRLPLHLTRSADVDELARLLRRSRGATVLTEVFPDLDGAWVTDDAGRRFVTELVVPLVRRHPSPAPGPRPAGRGLPADLRPPGSDWLFVKLYTGREMEEDLLAGAVHELVGQVAAVGFSDWFFLRYSDPGRHIRLRFRGDPGRLLADLLPLVSAWATDLVGRGECLRFAFDTYERELERFGGAEGTSAAEELFAADSAAVVELLHRRSVKQLTLDPLALAVLGVDALLEGLGLPPAARAEWCRAHGGRRREDGADYRAWKASLRPLLADAGGECPPLAAMRTRLHAAAASFSSALARLHADGRLTCAPAEIYPSITHLHLNRLLGADGGTERRVYALLGRLRAGLVAAPLTAVSGRPGPGSPR